ncbi:hypothetical protein SUGI_0052260 [Cryptomeria japonica]|nr:hypothetical protein SUGI_0052260 [Cryptomeria japonica]
MATALLWVGSYNNDKWDASQGEEKQKHCCSKEFTWKRAMGVGDWGRLYRGPWRSEKGKQIQIQRSRALEKSEEN